MSDALAIAAVVSLLLLFNALYVGAEFAVVAARRTRISQMAASGHGLARMLLPILDDSRATDRFVAVCQVGITGANLVFGAYGHNVLAVGLAPALHRLFESAGPLLARLGLSEAAFASGTTLTLSAILVLFSLTVLQVVLGELFPKSVAIQYPERVALLTLLPVRWTQGLLKPFVAFLNRSGNLVLRLLGVEIGRGSGRVHSPEEIEILVSESHQGGLLDDEERVMLRNAFRMRELTARQVMIHRTRILAAPAGSQVEELLQLCLAAGHTRLPLYQDTIDNIFGFVHIKDLFRLHLANSQNLAEILREVVHVPETLSVGDVWETLKSQRQYMAIVFDEFGGTAGLITFEDLIEEIFGELQDEFDEESALISQDPEGRIYLRGELLVSDVNEYLLLDLPDSADTLGGLVLSQLGRPPEVGDQVTFGPTTIRVEAMDDVSVSEVSLQTERDDVGHQVGEWHIASHE
ncbi:MAG: hemolysin family protein [Candidatus Promineifilaceae bacterium]